MSDTMNFDVKMLESLSQNMHALLAVSPSAAVSPAPAVDISDPAILASLTTAIACVTSADSSDPKMTPVGNVLSTPAEWLPPQPCAPSTVGLEFDPKKSKTTDTRSSNNNDVKHDGSSLMSVSNNNNKNNNNNFNARGFTREYEITRLMYSAIKQNDIHGLRFLANNGFRPNSEHLLVAIMYNRIKMIDELQSRYRVPVHKHALGFCCLKKNMELLLYFVNNKRVPLNNFAAKCAVQSKSLRFVKYLRSQGCPFDAPGTMALAIHNSLPYVLGDARSTSEALSLYRFLVREKTICNDDPTSALAAVSVGRLDILQDLQYHRFSIPVHECLATALERLSGLSESAQHKRSSACDRLRGVIEYLLTRLDNKSLPAAILHGCVSCGSAETIRFLCQSCRHQAVDVERCPSVYVTALTSKTHANELFDALWDSGVPLCEDQVIPLLPTLKPETVDYLHTRLTHDNICCCT